MKYRTLNNGIQMPMLGFGTYKIPNKEMDKVINVALDAGYRLFDTAQIYANEIAVGSALANQTKVKREELFITTKIWPTDLGYEKTKKALEGSLERLQLDYIDLVLVHWPYSDYYGGWKALEEAVDNGKVKSIGVSNFDQEQLEDLIIWNRIKPAINQIELHPFYQRPNDAMFSEHNDVLVQSWASFARGKDDAFTNETLEKIGKKYNKSNAQIILRWLLQNDIATIPKSQTPERIKENIDIFDFELSQEDMDSIKLLDKKKPLFGDPSSPDTVIKISTRIPEYDK